MRTSLTRLGYVGESCQSCPNAAVRQAVRKQSRSFFTYAQLRHQELADKDEAIILHCHHGMRSDRACQFLAAQGFTNLKNLSGGIDDWSLQIDPSVPRY